MRDRSGGRVRIGFLEVSGLQEGVWKDETGVLLLILPLD